MTKIQQTFSLLYAIGAITYGSHAGYKFVMDDRRWRKGVNKPPHSLPVEIAMGTYIGASFGCFWIVCLPFELYMK